MAVKPRLRETTANGYQMAVDRLTAGLGSVKLGDLTPLAIERFNAELMEAGGRRGQGLLDAASTVAGQLFEATDD